MRKEYKREDAELVHPAITLGEYEARKRMDMVAFEAFWNSLDQEELCAS